MREYSIRNTAAVLDRETAYYEQALPEKVKRLGQYFTPPAIADFMAAWIADGAVSVLDPAVGNSVFFKAVRSYNHDCRLTGYETDPEILDFFDETDYRKNTIVADFLLSDWAQTYDRIIGNPPYNRFQAIPNRREINDSFAAHTGMRCSGYTNLYILFLLKALHQLSDTGRLAFLVPAEFLNCQYGAAVKQTMLAQRMLKAILYFDGVKIFSRSVTTCCILLLDHTQKDAAAFWRLSDTAQLQSIDIDAPENAPQACIISYGALDPQEKWLPLLRHANNASCRHTVPLSTYCRIARGVATGDNDYFVLTAEGKRRTGIPTKHFKLCAVRSSVVKRPFATKHAIAELAKKGKPVYLLDIRDTNNPAVRAYITQGLEKGVHKKYLTGHRAHWYAMENKAPAPIWVSTAGRAAFKIVRNTDDITNLTAFHSLFMRPEMQEYTDILFCYLLTPAAQALLYRNRKQLGNGLSKLQPRDLAEAQILDLRMLSPRHLARAQEIYEEMKQANTLLHIEELNAIFLSYLSD